MPQGKVINRHPAVLVAWGSFLKNSVFWDILALCHICFKTGFRSRTATPFYLDFIENFLHLNDSWQIWHLYVWQKCHISWHVLYFVRNDQSKYYGVASGSKSLWYMYSKKQHALLAYVHQAVYSSNEQCSKQQQQQHKQPYSCLQQAPAPHNHYYCMQFRSSSSTLLSILLYIA